jgi:hypothetical protein
MAGRGRIANDVHRVMEQLRRASLCRTCLADVTGLEWHTMNRALVTICPDSRRAGAAVQEAAEASSGHRHAHRPATVVVRKALTPNGSRSHASRAMARCACCHQLAEQATELHGVPYHWLCLKKRMDAIRRIAANARQAQSSASSSDRLEGIPFDDLT